MITGHTHEGASGCAGEYGYVGKETKKREPTPVYLYQELRIGSYIFMDGQLIKVDIPFFTSLNGTSALGGSIRGVPITEKLLLSIGYRKQINIDWDGEKEYESEPYYFNDQIKMWELDKNSFGLFLRDGKFYYLGGGYPEIKYLHQLQNIFLSKANEEIIINKNKLKIK